MKILIDNGHGENTAGKGSPFSLNKTLPELPLREYAWARELAAGIVLGLRRLGYDAELLVQERFDVKLIERCHRVNVLCNALGKENVLLVSVHGNAFGMGVDWNSARGWSAYTCPGQTKSDILADHLYAAAEKNFPKDMRIRTEKQPDGDKDYEANFYILKNTLCPAVLTENFFYTNIDDCTYMLSEEGKATIVQTHIDGIISYIESL